MDKNDKTLQKVEKSMDIYLKHITNEMLQDKTSLKNMSSEANIKAFTFISFRKVLEDYIGKMDDDEQELFDKFKNKLGEKAINYFIKSIRQNYEKILNSM